MCQSKTAVRIYQPQDMPLFKVNPASTNSGTGTPSFIVPTPDARIETKAAILFYQDAGTGVSIPFDVTLSLTLIISLAVQAADKTPSGYAPTTDLIGTAATPQSIPFTTNLNGISIDTSGNQDAVIGTLTLLNPGAPGGNKGCNCVLRVRYNATVEMTDYEWDLARALMNPRATGFVQM